MEETSVDDITAIVIYNTVARVGRAMDDGQLTIFLEEKLLEEKRRESVRDLDDDRLVMYIHKKKEKEVILY